MYFNKTDIIYIKLNKKSIISNPIIDKVFENFKLNGGELMIPEKDRVKFTKIDEG